MKKQRFELHQGGRAIASVLGYQSGNFFVYKDYRYWNIAHLHTHTRFLAGFARRKDALAVVETVDSALWDFAIAPAEQQLENIYAIWVAAIGQCENIDGILYSPEQNVADTTE